jgi:glycosyltransferase involved in cell wall biosynthesis
MSPEVSVVMAVHNGAPFLRRTLDSVLAQKGVNFEFIIVNDGSNDETANLLSDYASRDPRIKVLSQENRGLTDSLIRGCSQARGQYIARQDSGDVSITDRLCQQLKAIKQRDDCVLVSCGTRFVSSSEEFLYELSQNGEELESGLDNLTVKTIRGPTHHGSTMFRHTAYENCGGYRSDFRVAQDLDLWLRLREQGRCLANAFIGYEALWTHDSISNQRRKEQVRFARLAIKAAQIRRSGFTDKELLDAHKVKKLIDEQRHKNTGLETARGYYYIGSCIARRDPKTAQQYFKKAWIAWPFHFKAIARLASGR